MGYQGKFSGEQIDERLTNAGDIPDMKEDIDAIRRAVGTPLTASTVAGMTDKTKIYVYVGNETGYTYGNWYYWNGSAWTSGGVYNSTAFNTDKTLLVSGEAADAKEAGKVRDQILNNNSFDVLYPLPKSDRNYKEVTFEWNSKGDVCHVSGTSTAEAFVWIYYDANHTFPPNFAAGKTYELVYSDDKVYFDMYFYDENGIISDAHIRTKTGQTFAVPAEAIGMNCRLFIAAANVTTDTYVSPKILTAKTNATLGSEIAQNTADVESAEGRLDNLESEAESMDERITAVESSLGVAAITYTATEGKTPSDATSTGYSRIDYIDVSEIDSIDIDTGDLGVYYWKYDADKNVIGYNGWYYGKTTLGMLNTAYVQFTVRWPLGHTQTSPTEAEILANIKISASMINAAARIRALEEESESPAIENKNPLLYKYFPPNSKRFSFSKGKFWEYMWDTLPAIEAAMQDPDCWSTGVDVRETSDGHLVCFHNATVGNGFTDSADQTLQIEDMTCAETQEINVIKGIWNGSSWESGAPTKIPLLSDVLNLVRSYGKVLNIETKGKGSTNIAPLTNEGMETLATMVTQSGMLHGCTFICGGTGNQWLFENYPKTARMYFNENMTTTYIQGKLYDYNAIFLGQNSSLTPEVLEYAREKDVIIGGYTKRTTNDEDEEMIAKNLDFVSLHQAPPSDSE